MICLGSVSKRHAPTDKCLVCDHLRALEMRIEIESESRERARIVDWLRRFKECGLAKSYARGIDRGEHLK